MNATVQKWGNSLALRIPKSLAQDADLRQGSAVELEPVEGGIMVRPQKRRKISLPGLLKAITKTNIHAEADWGRSKGGETW